jgi:hypothetical protein
MAFSGQIVFSPKNKDAADVCETFFGAVGQGSSHPPYGSGTVDLYDSMQNHYVATYTPTSFTVDVQGCTYTFAGPKINTGAVEGMVKVVLDGAPHGPACAAVESSPCFASYWITTGVNGIFTFVDTASASCPAFFAVANEGSNQEQGTMTIAGVAVMQATTWVPPGYSAAYNTISRTVEITTPGCSATYKLDPSQIAPSELDFPSGAPPSQAGSAVLDYIGASSPKCPSACVSQGFNVIWDASGAVMFLLPPCVPLGETSSEAPSSMTLLPPPKLLMNNSWHAPLSASQGAFPVLRRSPSMRSDSRSRALHLPPLPNPLRSSPFGPC